MDFELNEDQRAVEDAARRFARERLAPFAAEWDETRILPGRDAARSCRAWVRGDLCEERCRRIGHVASRRRDHHGRTFRGLHLDGRLHLHPQHGVVDDRSLWQRRAAQTLPSQADDDGDDRELLPDRAGLRLGRRGAQDARGAGRRRLCSERKQGIHLRRGRFGHLCLHGAHRRRRPQGHLMSRRRKGNEGPVVRQEGTKDRLEQPTDGAGDFRQLPGPNRKSRRCRRARAFASR